jgi:hypothetical protein
VESDTGTLEFVLSLEGEVVAKPADYKMRIIECFRTATAYAAHLAS